MSYRTYLPLERKRVVRSTAPRISNPDDRREIVFARRLLLDEDLAAASLFSQSHGDTSIRQRVAEVWLRVVIRTAANRLNVSRATTNSDPHIVVNAPAPGHAPAAV